MYLARLIPAVWITDNDVVTRHDAIGIRCGTVVLVGNAVVLSCDLLVLLRDDRVVMLPICLPRARCVHSRRAFRAIHVRLIVRFGVVDVHVLMRARLRCACTLRCTFTPCLCGDIRIVLRNGSLLIGVLFGVLVFVVLGLADLRQRQPQTQTKSKNSFHSVYLIYLVRIRPAGACLFNTVN